MGTFIGMATVIIVIVYKLTSPHIIWARDEVIGLFVVIVVCSMGTCSSLCVFVCYMYYAIAATYIIDFFSFTSSIITFSVYSHNLSINYSHAGVHGAQRRWGVAQGSFNQR